MFLHARPNPTPTKHVIYLTCTVLLGLLLSFIVHAGIESLYLTWAQDNGAHVTWYSAFGALDGGCALHPVIQWGLIILGAVGGYALGRFWWRMVYIERRWSKDEPTPAIK